MTEVPDASEALRNLNLELQTSFGEVMELNGDIISATRTMAHNLLTIRNAHLEQADHIMEIVKNLAISAQITSELTADMISAEWGITVDQFMDDQDEEENDEEE